MFKISAILHVPTLRVRATVYTNESFEDELSRKSAEARHYMLLADFSVVEYLSPIQYMPMERSSSQESLYLDGRGTGTLLYDMRDVYLHCTRLRLSFLPDSTQTTDHNAVG
jgi:hypothetical protein